MKKYFLIALTLLLFVNANATNPNAVAKWIDGLEFSGMTVGDLSALAGFPGTRWYVNSAISVSGDGLSWDTAKKTITAAEAAASAGDVIYITGSFAESVTLNIASVAIIGIGTGPAMTLWNAAAGNDKVNLTISAANCLVQNIKFRPGPKSSTYSACIELATGDDYTRIIGCRFQGSAAAYYGIYSLTPCGNVEIDGNEFIYFNTLTNGAAILGVEATGLAYSSWKVTNNIFNSCVTALNIGGRACIVKGNTFFEYGLAAAGTFPAAVMTLGIDLSGTDCGANVVTGNYLSGTYSETLYKDGTNDSWGGNFNVGGVTAANPAP
jgi:hypothetical protein